MKYIGELPAGSSALDVEASWNVMAHAQKPDFVFRRNGRVHLNRRGRQFSRLLAAEMCASAVVMLDTPCPEVVWRVLATHSIRQFPLHFPSHAPPCAITFQLEFTQGMVAHSPNDVSVLIHKPLYNSTSKHSRTPLIRKLVIRIGLALRVNLSIILQNQTCLEITDYRIKYSRVLWLLEFQIRRGRKV